jgi:thioredoxin reductase (NADPH)
MSGKNIENVIIIGSGPAGLTAAIYAARADLKPLVMAGIQFGGQLMQTTEIENFPGFPEGLMGPELMQNFIKQAERFGARLEYSNVTKVEFQEKVAEGELPEHKVFVGDKEYLAHTVIVATGAVPRKLSIPGETEFWGRGVSSCATCDGAFYREKVVAVIGGGDSAMEEATFLTKFASKVYVIHRRDELRASKIMQKRAKDNDKIEFLFDTLVNEVKGEITVNALALENAKTGEKKDLTVDGMFLAIGYIPETELFGKYIDVNENGYAVPLKRTTTKVPGVFVAGDIEDDYYRQAITAAGDGCKAALDAEKWLAARE